MKDEVDKDENEKNESKVVYCFCCLNDEVDKDENEKNESKLFEGLQDAYDELFASWKKLVVKKKFPSRRMRINKGNSLIVLSDSHIGTLES